MIRLEVVKLHPDAMVPIRVHNADAGIDLFALEDVALPVTETIKVRTGIAVAIPDGYFGKILDRSSMASKGLLTMAGVIDSGYRGEILVVMSNLSNHESSFGMHTAGYVIKKGDKIAQMIILPVPEFFPVAVSKFSIKGERGAAGFGSSGR